MTDTSADKMEKIVSLAKRRGFVYRGSEIYGGLAGTWDYGPYGVLLKNNIKNLWWRMFVEERDDMYGIDSTILMNPKVWEASGHIEGFHDPLVEDKKTHKRYRADHLLEKAGVVGAEELSIGEMRKAIEERDIKSPEGNELTSPQQFNMMYKTKSGSVEGEELDVYLRPETAQGMFVNFKNVVDSLHPKLPFGIAQIGRTLRNEISARDFLFRTREFEIMEFEYFLREGDWEKWFEYWREEMRRWTDALGIARDHLKEKEISETERAHYSKRTTDFYYQFPFGSKELNAIAYRTDYDLKQHSRHSGVDLVCRDEQTGEKITPHVIEPTFGLDRNILAVLTEHYDEDELGGERRVVLRFPKRLAPVKVAVFPLVRNKPELVAKARDVYEMIKKKIPATVWDDNGNIGKRYRRQDEIGTPHCVTIDHQTLDDGTVTIRNRDNGEQDRAPIEHLATSL